MGNEEGAVAGICIPEAFGDTPPDQFVYSMVDGASLTLFHSIKAK